MSNSTNIEINITGDVMVAIRELKMEFEAFKKQINVMSDTVENGFKDVNKEIGGTSKSLNEASIGVKLLAANAIRELTDVLSQPFIDGANAVYDYDSALREVSAITGMVGEGLDDLGGYARESSREFGGKAADHLKTYQYLLSELTPELAKQPKALKEMGRWASTLGKTMGGDTAGATRALNSAMNQYGIDLSNPMEASKEMRKIMNQMAASAQAGSVEVPQVAMALDQAGMAADAAGLSFAETNSALQVLGKAGKKGSEGGVALRNVLRIMGRDDFMPKEVADRMRQYGVDLGKLSDPAVNFREKLIELKKIQDDGTLLSGLFGENEIAGRALIQNIDLFDQFKVKIEENKTAAEDMAETIASSLQERRGRIMAFFDDMKLGMFSAFGDGLVYAELAVGGLAGFIGIMPGIMAAKDAIGLLATSTKLQAFWTGIITPLTKGWAFATKLLGGAFRFAMGPIGWVITGLGLVTAGVMYAWNNFEGFRKAIFGIWEAVKKVFGNIAKFIGDMMQPFFDAISLLQEGKLLKAAAALGKGVFNLATSGFQFGAAVIGGDITEGLGDAYDAGAEKGAASYAASQKEREEKETEVPLAGLEDLLKDNKTTTEPNGLGLHDPAAKTDGLGVDPAPAKTTTNSAGSARNINTRIENLVGTVNVYVEDGANEIRGKIRQVLNEELTGAVRDFEIAVS